VARTGLMPRARRIIPSSKKTKLINCYPKARYMKRLKLRLLSLIIFLLTSCQSQKKHLNIGDPTLTQEEKAEQLTREVEIDSGVVQIEILLEDNIKEIFQKKHSNNKVVPPDLLKEEYEYLLTNLFRNRRCFRATGEQKTLTNFFKDYRIAYTTSKEATPIKIATSRLSNIFCTEFPQSLSEGSVLILKKDSPKKASILEWSTQFTLSNYDLNQLKETAYHELPSTISLDLIENDKEQKRVLKVALSTHNLKYVKKILSKKKLAYSPGDRNYIFKLFQDYAIASRANCDNKIAEHLIISGASIDAINDTRSEGTSIALDCPMFAEFLYVWSPAHREQIVHHVNELFVSILNSSTPKTPRAVLDVSKLYKIILERLLFACQSGDESQCVVAELFFKNYQNALPTLSRFEQNGIQTQRQKMQGLFEELQKRNAPQQPAKQKKSTQSIAI